MTLRITLLVLVTGLFAMIWTHDQPAPTAAYLPQFARQHAKPAVAEKARGNKIPEQKTRGASLGSEPTLLPALIVPLRQSFRRETLCRINAHWEVAVQKSSPYLMRAGGAWAKHQMTVSSRQLAAWLAANINRPASPRQIAVKPIKLRDQKMPRETQITLPEGIVPGEYRLVSNTGIVRPLVLTLEDLQINRAADAEFMPRDMYESTGENCRWYFIRVQTRPETSLPAIAERGRHITLPAIAQRSPEKHLERQASQIIVNAGQMMAQHLARIALGND